MRNFIVMALILLMSPSLMANDVTSSRSDIDFAKIETGTTANETVRLTNSSSIEVQVELAVMGDGYALSASTVSISPGSFKDITVSFSPIHNITHLGWVVFRSNDDWQEITLSGLGDYPGTYYDATENKWDADLLSSLKTTISSGYKSLGYTTARDNMYASIFNTGGKVECVYTGRVATFNSRSGANSVGFNCEHTYPQSMFNSSEPERSDIHHLFPTDATSNSVRSNYAFGMVSNPTWSNGGSKRSGSTFEPRDAQKGATARAMLYFVVRYSNYDNFLNSQESILVQWHNQHQPTQTEKDRNDDIFSLQKNRNPFVDHPELTDRIHSFTGAKRIRKGQLINPVSNVSAQLSYWDDDVTFWVYNSGDDTVRIDKIEVDIKHLTMSDLSSADFRIAPGVAHAYTLNKDRSTSETGDWNGKATFSYGTSTLEIPLTVSGGTSYVQNPISKELKLFPNPAQDFFTLDINEKITTVSVFNHLGQLVRLTETLSHLNEFDINELQSGTYFVIVKTATKTYRSQLMIK